VQLRLASDLLRCLQFWFQYLRGSTLDVGKAKERSLCGYLECIAIVDNCQSENLLGE
jgi:hypothetical protein